MKHLAALALATSALFGAHTPALAETPVFTPRLCAEPALEGKARCGYVEVAENRDRPGRRIRLNVIVLPALRPGADATPQYDIEGGPGMPTTIGAGFYLTDGEAYRTRDIVLVDQRGTGGSNPLHCPELTGPEAAYDEMYPAAGVAACRKRLEQTADLTRYGTAEAVVDLDAVRQALGHERINLFAISYGTTVALRYLATHGERVRSAVLWGAAPSSAMPPRDHAPNAWRMLQQLFADCAADAACSTAYPGLSASFTRALARLPASGSLSREVFAEKLRSLMYTPAGFRRVPRIIHAAAAGDLAPFRAATGASGGVAAEGMYLAVTCAESLAGMDYEAAAAAARRTPFGDYRLRRQREACRDWPVARVPATHWEPVVSQAPVLFISGLRDPVTPPDWASEARARMPRAAQVVIAHGGHLFEGLENVGCVDVLVLAFYVAGSVEGLDQTCVATMTPPAFELPAP